MNRREFLRSMALGSAASALPLTLHAQPSPYSGRFLLVLQTQGAWDVTNFCDPKENIPGELEITHWSRTQSTQTAGGINYAPIGSNAAFFNKYHNDMLVINGVDTQTNSHSVGELHNWSGKNSPGFPTLTAMFAAQNALDVPLSYINFGGFANGARLIRYSRLDSLDPLVRLTNPNTVPWDNQRRWRNETEYNMVAQYRSARLDRLQADEWALPKRAYNELSQAEALESKQLLGLLAAELPASSSFQEPEAVNEQVTSDLTRQMQLALHAFKSGVASAADLFTGGYDTHTRHDLLHEPLIDHLGRSIDFLWEYADQLGIADQLTLVIGSDFARTPYYNAETGKDHWPIGSMMVMERGAPWGNRVIGKTDGGQNAYKINPDTLQEDASATNIYPKHVHKALRRYLNLENTAVDENFRFTGVEDFDFFNPAKTTT